jgi:hypothetical protein
MLMPLTRGPTLNHCCGENEEPSPKISFEFSKLFNYMDLQVLSSIWYCPHKSYVLL